MVAPPGTLMRFRWANAALPKTVLGFRKSRITLPAEAPREVWHMESYRVLEARTQPCGSGGGRTQGSC